MNIIPAAGVTRKITKLFELNQADVTDATRVWKDRVSGNNIVFTSDISKDANGVFSAITQSLPNVAAISLPAMSGFIGVIAITKSPTAAATVQAFNYGNSVDTGVAVNSQGAYLIDGADTTANRSLTALTTNAAVVASVGLFDFTVTSPILMCCHGNSTQIQYDFTYSEATNLKLTAATPAGITIASLVNAASDGRRIKYAAVVRFDKKPTEQELMAAVFEMQSTGVMYAKWLV